MFFFLLEQNYPHLWRPPSEPQTQNKKTFFSISTKRPAESVDALNSFLAQSAGEL